MDTDWCLTCERHFEGAGPYCSTDCQISAGPSCSSAPAYCFDTPSESCSEDDDDIIYHQVAAASSKSYWIGNGDAGILAWAADIPSGAPVGPSSSADDISIRSGSSASAYRAPKLLHQRPTPPTLCMSTPQPARSSPSPPIVTPQQQMAAFSTTHSGEVGSMGKTSLLSGLTESSVATPASARPVPITDHKPSILGVLATHVRSWASPSPLASSHMKRPTPIKPKPQNFTVLAQSHEHSSIDDLSDGDISPAWWLSATIIVDTPTKSSKAHGEPLRGRRLPSTHGNGRKLYRARGRVPVPSRAVA